MLNSTKIFEIAEWLEKEAGPSTGGRHYEQEILSKFLKTASVLREVAWRVREIDLLLTRAIDPETFLENWHDQSMRELMQIAHDMVPLKLMLNHPKNPLVQVFPKETFQKKTRDKSC